MRETGMPVSRPKALAERAPIRTVARALACCAATAVPGLAQEMPHSLTGTPGDPERGRAIVAEPTRGLCVLCHAGPFPEHRFMGNLAPPLDGVGSRLTIGELRAQIVDSRRRNPDTIMPPFHATSGLSNVGARWQGETILTAQDVEDVVAYLVTLTEETR
ncbi:sulfur oxidation c-type cytochrome SoxX [Primorskyibacter sp. 2E233]|uniref:sulfur oxidation c-type cytochrome SoxX n=1 Tax=Primorskyibacter sp. 2E233 TaxID=3413431 RepID=UPI003BF10B9C